MIKKIIGSSDPRLRVKSKPVTKVDKKVLGIIKDLTDTLEIQKDPIGVGLAAPQLGKNLRIFVMKHEGRIIPLINPEIVSQSKTKIKPSKNEILEGCLSLPHYYGPLARNSKTTVKYLNPKGKEEIREFKGFSAQIVQHEVDHLNGILFIDRLIEKKSPLYKLNGKEWEEVELA